MFKFRYYYILLLFFSPFCFGSEINTPDYTLIWTIPFCGVLLSIALGPSLLPNFWHNHFGKIMLFWILLFSIPFIISFGYSSLLSVISHAMIAEYIPFTLLLSALFTVSGGVLIDGNLPSSPKNNTLLLGIGTLIASIIGTTGASMLLIRPLIRANKHRLYKMHLVIFFIFLVANIGGGLTPLGDPPLFLGFLNGVDFFWTTKNLAIPVISVSIIVLIIFYFIDSILHKKERDFLISQNLSENSTELSLSLHGKFNIILLFFIILLVLLSGIWRSSVYVDIFGTKLKLENVVRDSGLIIISLISLRLTNKSIRQKNEFNWEPIKEVAKLFIAIFITITPIITMLRLGENGTFAPLLDKMHDENQQPINMIYFWVCSLLSAFLDNAPTYLVFFHSASGDAELLMGPLNTTLIAISIGTIFTGPATYIANAPNFMVRSIAIQQGVKMPSFFAYMIWPLCILIPIYIVLSLILF